MFCWSDNFDLPLERASAMPCPACASLISRNLDPSIGRPRAQLQQWHPGGGVAHRVPHPPSADGPPPASLLQQQKKRRRRPGAGTLLDYQRTMATRSTRLRLPQNSAPPMNCRPLVRPPQKSRRRRQRFQQYRDPDLARLLSESRWRKSSVSHLEPAVRTGPSEGDRPLQIRPRPLLLLP